MSVDKGDQNLLDRLNALKGNNDAGISLDRSSNALNASITIEKAKPPSKEDALTARLRSLRNTPERDIPPVNRAIQDASPSPSPLGKPTSSTPRASTSHKALDDADIPLDTDDQTLDELLGPSDDTQGPPEWAQAPKVEPGHVEALLEELSRGITPSSAPTAPNANRPQRQDTSEEQPPDADEASDGEDMTRDVHTLLSRALDEAELEARLHPPPDPTAPDPTPSSEPPAQNPEPPSPGTGQPPDDTGLSLPSVPSALSPDAGLSLPSVPSTAAGLAPADIEADLAARMAALSAPSDTDSIGLPSVPSDQPANRLRSRTGYTDADTEKWCTVCLEDATLRCLGCDDDVYCTRCWREMHVGPVAAFDDRTHKAVLFGRDPRKKEGKTLVGA